jgi:hypothetical protein
MTRLLREGGVFVSFRYFDIEFYYAAQTGLEFAILLPQPPECRDYRWAPPLPTFTKGDLNLETDTDRGKMT